MTDLEFITLEWQKLVAELEAPDEKLCLEYLDRLLEYYTQPHRHYHNLSHLRAMFDDFYDCHDQLENPNQVRAAILYHDIFYRVASDAKPGENEYVSARMARDRLEKLGFDAEFTDAVKVMILATADHKLPQDASSDLRFFLDMDMAILGSNPAKYQSYRDAVRAEYARYYEDSFAKGRIELFLKPTLAQQDIFYTPYFKERLESQARINMRQEIHYWESKLQARGLLSRRPK